MTRSVPTSSRDDLTEDVGDGDGGEEIGVVLEQVGTQFAQIWNGTFIFFFSLVFCHFLQPSVCVFDLIYRLGSCGTPCGLVRTLKTT